MDEKWTRAIMGCSWLAIFIQGKKRETQNKNQKKKKKVQKGKLFLSLPKTEMDAKGMKTSLLLHKGNCGLFIRNVHPRKTDTQNPKKINKQKFAVIFHFQKHLSLFQPKNWNFKEFFNCKFD